MTFLLCRHSRWCPPCDGGRRWYRGILTGRWCTGLGPQSQESGRAHRETWRTKGEEEVEENGVRCVMTELNKTSNRKNYFGSLAGPLPHAGRLSQCCCSQAADSHERCCSTGFERSTGSGGGRAASGARRLIKGSSGLMRGDLCKQCRVRGERSGNILCD